MGLNELQMREIERIYSIRKEAPDDIFITCGSFEDRFLGIPKKLGEICSKRFILFRFTVPNDKGNRLIEEMEELLNIDRYKNNYQQIPVEYGRSMEAILNFHKYLLNNNLFHTKDFFITIDISTFTKDLLLNLLFYLNNFLRIKKLRLLYTLPRRYASPEEGGLSYGIKNIHMPPMYWNGWSPIKDDLMIILLGYEETRAWSLIDRFNADLNWLFITSPGPKPELNSYCEEYNRRLLNEILPINKVPAIDPIKTSAILSNHITKDVAEKYNIFISPLGTKPQIIGVLYFYMHYPDIPINIITTTVVEHNVPYYSWGIGNSFESFFPVKEGV